MTTVPVPFAHPAVVSVSVGHEFLQSAPMQRLTPVTFPLTFTLSEVLVTLLVFVHPPVPSLTPVALSSIVELR